MIPEYMRFYNYTVTEVLDEYARTFFALANSMFEIHAREMLDAIAVSSANQDTINELNKRQKGLGAIIEEVKIAKNVRKNNVN